MVFALHRSHIIFNQLVNLLYFADISVMEVTEHLLIYLHNLIRFQPYPMKQTKSESSFEFERLIIPAAQTMKLVVCEYPKRHQLLVFELYADFLYECFVANL